jgi:acetone carboxylase gamma subunit
VSEPAPNQPADRVISLSRTRDDKLWAVIAAVGRKTRIAEIYPSRAAADADRQWREQQVRAYAGFLRSSSIPMPNYSISPIRRADLPRSWRPLPALGFLRGQFI